MHYLATMVANNNPELLNLPEQFGFLAKLEQYRTKEILDQVLEHQKAIQKLSDFRSKLETKLDTLKESMRAAKKASAEALEEGEDEVEDEVDGDMVDDMESDEVMAARRVVGKLESFLEEAQTRYDRVVDLVATLDKSWRSTASYFGEKSVGDSLPSAGPSSSRGIQNGDDATKEARANLQVQQQQMVSNMTSGPRKPPEEIFTVLHEFFRHFREAHLQNEDILIREKRQAAMAKRMAASSPSPRGSAFRRTPTPALTDGNGSTAPSTPSSTRSPAPYLSSFSKLS